MKRRTTAIAVVMLALAMIITGCDPSASGSGGGNASAASMMKAMSQAVASAGTDPAVSGSGSVLTVTDFTADDGTRISGTIERDAEGNIISARLSFINPDGTAGPELVLATESGSQDVTYDDKPVNPDQLPQPMTPSQRVAFGGFLEGFEEAFDEIEDLMDDILEHYEDNPGYGVGTHQIDGALSRLIQGTVTLARERGDDDLEVTAADITSFSLPISRGGTASGSYSFEKRGDDDVKASMDIRITGFTEEDDGILIELSDVRVQAEIEENEVWDDDMFSFSGSIAGTYLLGGESHTVSFSGEMSALEDKFLSFPSYTLEIDDESVAIGRYEKQQNR